MVINCHITPVILVAVFIYITIALTILVNIYFIIHYSINNKLYDSILSILLILVFPLLVFSLFTFFLQFYHFYTITISYSIDFNTTVLITLFHHFVYDSLKFVITIFTWF